MRALWTAASGMRTQQHKVDIISNNIANVNTNAYKKVNTGFKDLVYENMKTAPSYQQDAPRPMVGHGVTVGYTSKDFRQGALTATERNLDVGIEGKGFFMVQDADGNIRFTRDGSFQVSAEAGGNVLVTSNGDYVLDSAGNRIFIGDPQNVIIQEDGSVYSNNDGYVTYSGSIALVDFDNREGLQAIGDNLYAMTDASGNMMFQDQSKLKQCYLESSNVSVAEEMVNLIVSQRAYQLNSRIVQTADNMMEIANDLRR
ncbi:MAG: flagellar hook-basal body protein [Clostridia bacterium]|nr:flagellar hook-basal body protein [Clostridia bacterium]